MCADTQVTLGVPWLLEEDQEVVYPKDKRYAKKEDQVRKRVGGEGLRAWKPEYEGRRADEKPVAAGRGVRKTEGSRGAGAGRVMNR